jgi:hypothetical protein
MASKRRLTLNVGMNWAAIAVGIVALFVPTTDDRNPFDPTWHTAPIRDPELHPVGLITRPSVLACGLRRWSRGLSLAVAGRSKA